MIKIGVVGTGYVGLVTGACLSKWHQVICQDVKRTKIELLRRGNLTIYEEGLEEIVKEGIESGHLSFTHHLDKLYEQSDVIFLCIGTPNKGFLKCYLEDTLLACSKLSVKPKANKLVVVKSTVLPGTNDKVIGMLNSCAGQYRCASNPEFLREGQAVKDFLHPERIVLGVRDQESLDQLLQIYSPINAPCLPMDIKSAEMSKYACNAALATKISFINEISNICESTGANILAVRDVMAHDSRIGSSFYEQGPGYGGSCFPKDIEALAYTAKKIGESTPVLDGVIATNKSQPLRIVSKLEKHMELNSGITVAVWGAAFKAGTDDIRHSITFPVVRELLKRGVNVRLHDPKAIPRARMGLPTMDNLRFYETNPSQMTVGTDALIVATPWSEYHSVPIGKIGSYLIVDCRQVLVPNDVESAGKLYEGFGY